MLNAGRHVRINGVARKFGLIEQAEVKSVASVSGGQCFGGRTRQIFVEKAPGGEIHFDVFACAILDSLERGDDIMRRDIRTAAAKNLRSIGVRTNDRNGFDFLEREHAVIF